MSIPPYQPPPKKSLPEWWDEVQASLKNGLSQFGLTRDQMFSRNNPVNQWDPSQQNLTPEMLRFWMGDKAVNNMYGVSNWYQQKIVPLWQKLANFDKSLSGKK